MSEHTRSSCIFDVALLLVRLANITQNVCADLLAKAGLTRNQFGVLCGLAEHSPTRQGDLAIQAGISPRNIGISVQPLLERDLITVVPQRDRNTKALAITPAGLELLASLRPDLERQLLGVFRSLHAAGPREALHQLLKASHVDYLRHRGLSHRHP